MPLNFELHISDVRTFKSCRRRWDWSSPLRGNLEPKMTPLHFQIGKAVHYALASYYETGELPVDTFLAYMEQERRSVGDMWPDDAEKFDKAVILGGGMMENYLRWVRSTEAPDDRWEIIGNEMPFGPLSILNPKGLPSNRITLAGRIDGILRDKNTGFIWLREYKTSSRDPIPSWLELDDQATMYCWAIGQIMGEPVAGIQYRFLMKRYPDKPPRLKNGGLSRAINSPQVMNTSYDMYVEAIQELAVELVQEGRAASVGDALSVLTPQYQDILDQLFERGYSEYFTDIEVRKTINELDSGAKDLWTVGLEMVRPTTPIYPAPEWLKCQFCPFKIPCKTTNAGASTAPIFAQSFRQRRYEDVTAAEIGAKLEWA